MIFSGYINMKLHSLMLVVFFKKNKEYFDKKPQKIETRAWAALSTVSVAKLG